MIGLREDQQMKARIIDYLNNATASCMSWLASDDDGEFNTAIAGKPAPTLTAFRLEAQSKVIPWANGSSSE